jgi:hypothetical protein
VVVREGDGGGTTMAANGVLRERREERLVVMMMEGMLGEEGIVAVVVKAAYSCCELVAFLPFEEELSDLLATALIGWGGLLLVLLLFLVLVVDGTETVLGIARLVFCLCMFRLDLPYSFFFEWEGFPAVADYL